MVATVYRSLSFLLEPYCVGEYSIDINSVSNEEDAYCKHDVQISARVDKVHKNVF